MIKERVYSKSIANAFCQFLNGDGWHFSFDESNGLFDFGLCMKGRLKKVNHFVAIGEGEYTVYATAPVGADESDKTMMASMAEFICRANYGLKDGNYEMDFRDGEIRYKIFADCSGITPTQEMVKNSLYHPASMFHLYGDGILGIIFEGMSAEEALNRCEKNKEDKLRSILAGLDEEEADGDVDSLISRLAARLGIARDEREDQPTEGSDDGAGGAQMDLLSEEGGAEG